MWHRRDSRLTALLSVTLSAVAFAGGAGASAGTTPLHRVHEAHPDLYRAFSPLRNVAELSSPLLAVAGTEDGQIPWWNASTFAAAARARGADVTMLLFDGEGHHVARKENREILRKATLGLLASACDE